MEELKLILSANKIYNKEFSGNKVGYDCLQVDTLLDAVINDYETFDAYKNKMELKLEEIMRLNKILNDRITKLETDNSNLKKQIENLQVPSSNYLNNQDNLELLKKISKLEEMVYSLGGDPSKI